MRWGTCYFDSTRSANNYYGRQGYTKDDVRTKLAEGEIHVGIYPPIKPGDKILTDKDGRYWIDDGKD